MRSSHRGKPGQSGKDSTILSQNGNDWMLSHGSLIRCRTGSLLRQGAGTMIAASDLKSSLSHFSGTSRYIRDPFTGLMHTDGIEHLAERAEAHWLVSDIGAVFRHHPKVKEIPFQLWTLDS